MIKMCRTAKNSVNTLTEMKQTIWNVWSLQTDVNMYHIKEGLGTREINVLSNGEYLEKA